MAFNNFKPPAAAPAPTAPMRSKYGGVANIDTRDPMLGIGVYRVRVVKMTQGFNPGTRRETVKTTLEILAAADGAESPVGSTATMITFLTEPGLRDLTRFAAHAAGYGNTIDDRAKPLQEAFAAFRAAEPYDGATIDQAVSGVSNGAPVVVGQMVDVIVAKGKPVMNPQTREPTGDYYREYVWGVAK